MSEQLTPEQFLRNVIATGKINDLHVEHKHLIDVAYQLAKWDRCDAEVSADRAWLAERASCTNSEGATNE